MRAPAELKFLRSIKTGKGLIKLIKSLREHRRNNKVKYAKRSVVSKNREKLSLRKQMAAAMYAG